MSKTSIPPAVRSAVAEVALHRCGYCLTQTMVCGFAMQIDHIIPESAGGTSDESNLWLACSTCNVHKSAKLKGFDPQTGQEANLFNPRLQKWDEHFEWSNDGLRILGLTPIGRATIVALQMNNFQIVKSRYLWVKAGWHPPQD
ncbi:MAG: HNH endonuclease signature motif containing protein [Chloroflexota bacterium]